MPEDSVIQERFVESTLRFFAQSKPEFWEDSERRFFCYASDLLGKLRVGQHLDSYEKILRICRKARFPDLNHGSIEVVFPEDKEYTSQTPDIYYRLNRASEWTDAITELRNFLGMQPKTDELPEKARTLLDYASKIPAGESQEITKEIHNSWSWNDCESAVGKAQTVNARLTLRRSGYFDSRIVVLARPSVALTLPSLDAVLNFPAEPTKIECDQLARRIENIVEKQFQAHNLSSHGLVLVRTASRRQALASFGRLDPGVLARVCSKLHPTGMGLSWSFMGGGAVWMLSVCPDNGMDWTEVIEAIRESRDEIPSTRRYGLSKEAAALFDWLRHLPQTSFEWGLAPPLTEDVLKTEVGLENPWKDQNAFLFFEILIEEITRKTTFIAVAHRWHNYPPAVARISFRAKNDP